MIRQSPRGNADTGSILGRNPPDGPDGTNAFNSPTTPPANSISVPSRTPQGTSYMPGLATSPEIEKNRRPLQPLITSCEYHWPPLIMIARAHANVSTLLTSVGLS